MGDDRLVEDRLDRLALVGGPARHPRHPGPRSRRHRPPPIICYSTILSSELTQYRISGGGAAEIAASIERVSSEGDAAPGRAAACGPLARRRAGGQPDHRRRRLQGPALARPRRDPRAQRRPRQLAPAGCRRVARRHRYPAGVRDLASGNPDPELLPDLAPVLRRLEPPRQLYGGDRPIRGCSSWPGRSSTGRHRRRGLAVTSGALDGIERALQAQLRPGTGRGRRPRLRRPLRSPARARPGAAAGADRRQGDDPGGARRGARRGRCRGRPQPARPEPDRRLARPGESKELRQVLDRHPEAMVLEDDHLGPIAGAPRLTLTAGRAAGRRRAPRQVARSGPAPRRPRRRPQTISRVRGRQAVGPGWVSHLLQRIAAALWSDAGVATTWRTRPRPRRAPRALRRRPRRAGDRGRDPTGLNVWIPVPEETSVVQALLSDGWAVTPGAPYPPAERTSNPGHYQLPPA